MPKATAVFDADDSRLSGALARINGKMLALQSRIAKFAAAFIAIRAVAGVVTAGFDHFKQALDVGGQRMTEIRFASQNDRYRRLRTAAKRAHSRGIMKGTRPKDLRYQRAYFLKDTGKTLQQHMDAARARLKYASGRAQKMGNDEDNVRLWNRRATRGLLTCGMFHSYERGRSQLVIEMNDGAEEYTLEAANPPKAKAKESKTEFNEGLLFFGVHRNHVLLLQSSALRQSAFDEYLNWFLQDATDEIGKDNRIELRDLLPKKLRQRNVPPLKSIIFTPPLHTEPAEAAQRGEGRTHVRDLSLRLDQNDWGWMRTMLEGMGAHVPRELRLDGDFNPERVQVEIHLRWKGRDKDREETPVLDTILRAFRDVDDPRIKAVTANGAELRGDELRLKKPVQIEVDGKIPLAGDVFEKMQAYMAELLESGEILAE